MCIALFTTLAEVDTAALLVWIGVLIVAVLIGAVVLVQLRKKLIDHPTSVTGAGRPPFTLEQLRQLRRDGQITDDEYEKAREQLLIAAGHRPAAEPDSPAAADDVADTAAPAGDNETDPPPPENPPNTPPSA